MDLRNELIEFLDSIRDYVRESGTNIAHDERESSEFVDTHLRCKLRQGAVSDTVCDCIHLNCKFRNSELCMTKHCADYKQTDR